MKIDKQFKKLVVHQTDNETQIEHKLRKNLLKHKKRDKKVKTGTLKNHNNLNRKKLCMLYTNTVVLTLEKLKELRKDINSTDLPDTTAITELNPKYLKYSIS